jgi:hypothetical protein
MDCSVKAAILNETLVSEEEILNRALLLIPIVGIPGFWRKRS